VPPAFQLKTPLSSPVTSPCARGVYVLRQSGGSYLPGYNCKLAVDSDHQVIVAVGVSNQPPDVEHLEPMLQRITATPGALLDVLTMDATVSRCRRNGGRCPEMPMPEPEWPAS
jgi:hypothetical protein